MLNIEARMQAYVRHAEAIGQASGPCPFVPGITPTMRPEDCTLLIRAWALRNFPPDMADKEFRDELESILVQIAQRWQVGALSRV